MENLTNPIQDLKDQGVPHEEIYRRVANSVRPETQRAFFEFRGRQVCIRQAMQKPLPGASADAFLNGALKVDGRTVHEVVPAHIEALQKLDSPLLRMGEQAAQSEGKTAKAEISEEAAWHLCFIFTTPPRELRKLNKGTKEAMQEKAESEWESKSAATINITVAAIVNQYLRHIKTSVKFAAEMEQSGDTSFFLEATRTP